MRIIIYILLFIVVALFLANIGLSIYRKYLDNKSGGNEDDDS